ncbi:hypothetical protein [Naumannella halotolerans]|uniref:Uncharacterized protein n=1 Tax=Naumannella halotolerans TaxID=993414 RepID=A0A4R7JCQ5_9ACTN|nr:hypothetical protein [Naumannella halotolerans]TDT34497.1 hypothetical protein CLV29_2167 [Naumannella halotolerans]
MHAGLRRGAIALALTVIGAFAAGHGFARADTGAAGSCSDDRGVTVVVDFAQLAPDPLIRCAADFESGSGLDALAEAGVPAEGVASSAGDAFVCRIDGQPSASTDLSASGKPGYREDCLDIPPTTAHWSYWYVEAGRWIESDLGARSRQVTKGGTEGWSYTLGEGPNRPPAVAPDGGGHASPEPADSSDCEAGGAGAQEEPGVEESDSPEGTGGLGSQEPPGAGASGSQEEPAAGGSASDCETGAGSSVPGTSGDPSGREAPTDPVAERPGPPAGTLLGVAALLLVALVGAGTVAWRRLHD